MRVLIFGASGQDGCYLTELCNARGMEVIGVSRGCDHIGTSVSNLVEVEQLIAACRPAFVFHLAANSTTRHDAIFENHELISTGTLNILEAVRRHHPAAKVFITGSGVQFRNTGKAISEHDQFDASSPYAVSRIHAAYAGRYYRTLGIKAYVGYLFHHESPRRKPNHVSQMIVQAVKRIAEGSTETIEIGDLHVQKEWTFAGDVVNGIMALMEQDEVFEAVIGSGVTFSIQDWLERCFDIVGRNWQEHVRIREGFKAEYQKLVSDPSTIKSLGWAQRVSFSQLAEMMVRA